MSDLFRPADIDRDIPLACPMRFRRSCCLLVSAMALGRLPWLCDSCGSGGVRSDIERAPSAGLCCIVLIPIPGVPRIIVPLILLFNILSPNMPGV